MCKERDSDYLVQKTYRTFMWKLSPCMAVNIGNSSKNCRGALGDYVEIPQVKSPLVEFLLAIIVSEIN